MRFRPEPVLTIASLLALAVLLRLGFWQLDRLEWKLGLISRVETQMALPPVPFSLLTIQDFTEEGLSAALYRPVKISGQFRHDREIHVFTRNDKGVAGYRIFTPLERPLYPPILIDRGYVPEKFKEPNTRTSGLIEGDIEISGIVRQLTKKGAFTPANNMFSNTWFSLEPFDDVRAALQMPDLLPFVIEADPQPELNTWPRGGPRIFNFKNDHLGYALTWFGLACTLIGVYVAYHIQTGRLILAHTKRMDR